MMICVWLIAADAGDICYLYIFLAKAPLYCHLFCTFALAKRKVMTTCSWLDS